MGEGESKREEGTMKDGEGREPETKKKKQSKDDTSSYSEDEDDDEEASFRCVHLMEQLSVTKRRVRTICVVFFFHPRKAKAERNTQKWTRRCVG